MSTKIVTVVGARPQFVKAAMLSRAIKQHTELTEILIHTGQHYDPQLSDIFFTELDMKAPHHHLRCGSGAHGLQTGTMLIGIEEILQAEQPDCVVVYGDTNSTLAGALAAAKLHIPIAHVEAGLRSFNRKMPEEINRALTDHLATHCFAPTKTAVINLRNEGIGDDKIILCGDIMADAAAYYGIIAEKKSQALDLYDLQDKSYVLATIHRAENTDDIEKLTMILTALNQFSQQYPVILPLHPRTKKMMDEHHLHHYCDQMILTPPLSFFDMIILEKNARLIATDSGGVQKEAYFYQVPCATLRTETEWVELITTGWNHLVPPTSVAEIISGLTVALKCSGKLDLHLYGNGTTAETIVKNIMQGKT
jgi:UDP-GlcNAc3NAcA epimerase